jgi:hypothetical protein
MRKRPVLLFISALLFLYFPLEFLWRVFGEAPFRFADFCLSFFLPILMLYGLIRVTKIGWYTLVAVVALLGIRDLQSYYAAQGNMIQFLVHILIYMASLSYFINPRIRHLYFDPKSRWWRTKRRYETHLPFLLNHSSVWHYPLLKNISEGGCFIETPHPLEVSDLVKITIPLPVPLGVSVLRTEGEVRWVSNHPRRCGMGIQFRNIEPAHERALREFVRQQL